MLIGMDILLQRAERLTKHFLKSENYKKEEE
jgi:hypothetical protein